MRRSLALALAIAAAPLNARAQEAAPARHSAASSEIDKRQDELRGLEQGVDAADAARRKMEGEVERMRADRARLAAALIDTAAKVQAAESRAGEIEERLKTLTGSQQAIKASLEARRGLLAQVLAAAQRMGRRPPPAILADPADMLKAIRSAMLLGAVMPQLREETQALVDDLTEMTRLKESILAERARLEEETKTLGAERVRLASLVDERKATLATAEAALAAERKRAADLARQATSLKDLIGRMESEVASAARAAEEARRADAAQRAAAADQVRAKLAAAPFHDPARLAPARPFAEVKGKLPWPVVGEIAKAYGAPDGFGGAEKGVSIRVRAGAAVTAPADGWVSFAGPWRSWGRLLILNAGDGYYLVLAGLARVDVEVGQFVLAGEPVGAMGEGSARAAAASAAVSVGGADPVLYVEFRKDGSAIDPGPWWARRDAGAAQRPDQRQGVRQDSEKVRG